jgi:hydrophobic/amphiphilic exporter-1 (mainly G- bacteria), HAE1 family
MSRFFVDRPIVAIVISIVTVLIGLVSMLGLPIAQFPPIVPPQIFIGANYPGADALTIEQSVATPLEQQMNGVDNMLYMQSINGNDGTMQLQVTFDVDTDPSIDQVNVQNRMAQAQPNLPPDVSNFGLTMRKSTGLPMLVVSLYSPKHTYDALFLSNYANININDALYRVPGVGQVGVFGAGDYAMRIWAKPDLLATLGLTVPDLARAVQQQSTVNPSGQVGAAPQPGSQEMTYTVRSRGRLQTPEEFGDIILRETAGGSSVRLRDVARIELGAVNYQQVGRVNGQPGCAIAVYQAPGSNALQVAAGVKALMSELKQRFPADLEYTYTLDTTLPVGEGIREILITLAEAMGLVLLVVYLFLQNWRATLIPMVAVPVSLIGTFAFFPMLGFSINTLSLFGLVLAIGLVVDDAIVVVEAVEHHIERGLSPREATLVAMKQVSGPVVSIAIILASVFIPVAFMTGIQGRLNKQFALTIAISVLISAFNALTLSPALSAMLLRPRKGARGGLFGVFNRWFEKATHGYIEVSRALIRKAVIGMVLLAVVIAGAAVAGRRLPTSFIPDEDYGYFFINLELPPPAALARTDAVCKRIDALLARTPGIATFNTVVGFNLQTRVTAGNFGFYFVNLKPWDERRSPDMEVQQVIARLRAAFPKEVPEARVFVVPPPTIPGLGPGGGLSMWLQDRSGTGDVNFLNAQVQRFLAEARKRPELTNVRTTWVPATPQLMADVDRDKVLKQGVALTDVYQTLQTFLGGLYVNQFNRFGRQWRVFLQAEGAERMTPEDIGQFYVRNNDGAMLPISTLQTTRNITGPLFTNRFNVFRSAQVLANQGPGYSTGQGLEALEEIARQTLPREVSYEWSDLSYQEKKVGSAAPIVALSMAFVFLILAALYESWSLPFSVLLSVPIALVGAFIGLLWRGYDFDVYAQIGIIMLIGLAAKNAILIVEFAKGQLEHGTALAEAALEGARLRLRPILMTSFAFILGCVPLWTASGSGAVARRILGTVVIAGMLAATLVAIFFIPMLFVLVERVAKGRTRARRPQVELVAGEVRS